MTDNKTNACQVNRAIDEALRDGAVDYEARGILVVRALEATRPARDADAAALHQAIYTIFRGLPARLPPGVVLYVATADHAAQRAVELSWEARVEPTGPRAHDPAAAARAALRAGPYGDLIDLALRGLETICGARPALHEDAPTPTTPSSSALAALAGARVRQRYEFIIPAGSGAR